VSLFIRKLARPLPALPEEALPAGGPEVYLDIETTGLKPDVAQITLVGLVFADGPVRVLEQYFVDTPADEAEVMRTVGRRLRALGTTVTYNGATFDLPFLRRRAQLLDLPWPHLETFDLLKVARQWRSQHGVLPDCRLQTVMSVFELGREDSTSGLAMVEAYYRWVAKGDPADRDLILDHNADDLLLLPDVFSRLSAPPAALFGG
jgi:uncharacterized protein YprB with RNaseH-like and TPR domain